MTLAVFTYARTLKYKIREDSYLPCNNL